jgi:hypothetical protein
MDETKLMRMRMLAMENCHERVIDLNVELAPEIHPDDRVIRLETLDKADLSVLTLPMVGSCPWVVILVYVGTANGGLAAVQDRNDGIHDFLMSGFMQIQHDSVCFSNVGGKYWEIVDEHTREEQL